MFAEHLTDLDEVVLRCRNEQAKLYIAEAVACYKAGAFRSSIVAAWIAVVFDFISKLEELELTGDARAKQTLEEFERIRAASDLRGALAFEKQVLDSARDDFELISPLEHGDLQRLAEDRNRCAHPSMNARDEAYKPSAELARLHIINAVRYCLQHPPVQGKAALDRLLKDVASAYFPIESAAAVAHFEFGPLKRPRNALVRNFVIVLSKSLVWDPLDQMAELRHVAALNAVRAMHRQVTEETLRQKLSDIIRGAKDADLVKVVRFLAFIEDTWVHLDPDVQSRLESYIQTAPSEESVSCFASAIRIAPLQKAIITRLKSLDASDLWKLMKDVQTPETRQAI